MSPLLEPLNASDAKSRQLPFTLDAVYMAVT
jgi:hypothetical protein